MDEQKINEQLDTKDAPEQTKDNISAPQAPQSSAVNEPITEAKEPTQPAQQTTSEQTPEPTQLSAEPITAEQPAKEQLIEPLPPEEQNEPNEPVTTATESEDNKISTQTQSNVENTQLSDQEVVTSTNQERATTSDSIINMDEKIADIKEKNDFNHVRNQPQQSQPIEEEKNQPIVVQIGQKRSYDSQNVKIVLKEDPIEKIIEKVNIKEVPVEKIVEKIVIKELPIEKIVERDVIREVKVLDRELFKEELKKTSIQNLIQARTAKIARIDLKKDRLIKLITNKGNISSQEIQLFLHVSAMTAWRYTKKLLNEGIIKSTGKRRARKYSLS